MNSIAGSERRDLRHRMLSVASMLAMVLSLVAVSVPGATGQTSGQSPSRSGTDQPAKGGSTAALGPSPVIADTREDYRIGPGDVIQVDVEKAPELSRAFRVTSTGTFLMPFLGRVKASGLTVEELGQQITERLKGEYLRHPIVSVAVREYNSRAFFILGSVRNPGVYQVEGRPSLLTLITLAGGLMDNHGSSAYIIRQSDQRKEEDAANDGSTPGKRLQASASTVAASTATGSQNAASADEDVEVTTVNISGLLRGYLDNNKFLQPRDIVNIPPADVFFVAGEVNKPGSFPLRDGTTLRQAVSLAQGTNFKAATSKSVIYRDDPKGGREEIHVDLGAVLSGKKDDVRIMPNDVIVVPNSQMKSIGGALLRAFGLNTVSRVPL